MKNETCSTRDIKYVIIRVVMSLMFLKASQVLFLFFFNGGAVRNKEYSTKDLVK